MATVLRQCTRRQFLRTAGAAAAVLGGTARAGAEAGGAAAGGGRGRANIIFILTDDQRFDAMGCAGNGRIRTPNMDALAGRGTRFDRAFVTLSICSPSRAACLTGRYGSATGVTALGRPLRRGERTFAHLLKRAGYQTGFAGKWHLGTTPAACGFDVVSSFGGNGRYYGRSVTQNGTRRTIPGFIDDFVAEESIRFIRSAAKADAPFVLWMCTQVPHMNHKFDWNARQQTLALYDPARMPVPETWQDDLAGKPPYLKTARSRTRARQYGYGRKEAIRRHTQRYYAAVTEVDASIGTVLAAVRSLGLDDTTWFILMGDNGWFMGEHGFTSKVLAYEESIRVPMIVAGPGLKARTDKHLVLNVDLAATVLDIAGVAAPRTMHGRSLLPLVRGRETAWRDDVVYEAPTPALGSWPLLAVRTERWKYIRTYAKADRSRVAFEELYDLRADPHEMRNLAADERCAGALRKLSARLDEHVKAAGLRLGAPRRVD